MGHDVLGSAVRTDGSFSHDVIVPVGGTLNPITVDNVADFRLTVPDPPGMKARLEQLSLDNFVGVVQDALSASNATPGDVTYIAMLHMKRSAHDAVVRRAVALERTVVGVRICVRRGGERRLLVRVAVGERLADRVPAVDVVRDAGLQLRRRQRAL